MENKNNHIKSVKEKPVLESSGNSITLPDGRVVKIQKVVNIDSAQIEMLKQGAPSTTTPMVVPPSKTEAVIRPASTEEKAEIQLREENVQEILTAVPNWMIRWGNTLLCSLVLLLLAISWFVRYPQVLTTKVKLVNEFPTQYLNSSYFQKYDQILVESGEDIQFNSPLMVKNTNANYEDLFSLKSITDTLQLNSKSFVFPFSELSVLSLGEVQDEFARFEESYSTYQNTNSHFRKLIEDYQQLKLAVDQWDQANVLRASLAGTVERMEKPQRFLKVIPPQKPRYIAQLQIPLTNSGKVTLDQKVQVRLDNYPEMEFGILEGKILNIERMENDSEIAYIAEAQLPEKLLTSYEKEINFEENLSGNGDIIIKNTRLIEQLLSSFQN